jgi:hypothetical protein
MGRGGFLGFELFVLQGGEGFAADAVDEAQFREGGFDVGAPGFEVGYRGLRAVDDEFELRRAAFAVGAVEV